jgi:hypothetical protein
MMASSSGDKKTIASKGGHGRKESIQEETEDWGLGGIYSDVLGLPGSSGFDDDLSTGESGDSEEEDSGDYYSNGNIISSSPPVPLGNRLVSSTIISSPSKPTLNIPSIASKTSIASSPPSLSQPSTPILTTAKKVTAHHISSKVNAKGKEEFYVVNADGKELYPAIGHENLRNLGYFTKVEDKDEKTGSEEKGAGNNKKLKGSEERTEKSEAETGLERRKNWAEPPRVQCKAHVIWPLGGYIECGKSFHFGSVKRHIEVEHGEVCDRLKKEVVRVEDSSEHASFVTWPRLGVDSENSRKEYKLEDALKEFKAMLVETEFRPSKKDTYDVWRCQLATVETEGEFSGTFVTCGEDFTMFGQAKKHIIEQHRDEALLWGLVTKSDIRKQDLQTIALDVKRRHFEEHSVEKDAVFASELRLRKRSEEQGPDLQQVKVSAGLESDAVLPTDMVYQGNTSPNDNHLASSLHHSIDNYIIYPLDYNLDSDLDGNMQTSTPLTNISNDDSMVPSIEKDDKNYQGGGQFVKEENTMSTFGTVTDRLLCSDAMRDSPSKAATPEAALDDDLLSQMDPSLKTLVLAGHVKCTSVDTASGPVINYKCATKTPIVDRPHPNAVPRIVDVVNCTEPVMVGPRAEFTMLKHFLANHRTVTEKFNFVPRIPIWSLETNYSVFERLVDYFDENPVPGPYYCRENAAARKEREEKEAKEAEEARVAKEAKERKKLKPVANLTPAAAAIQRLISTGMATLEGSQIMCHAATVGDGEMHACGAMMGLGDLSSHIVMNHDVVARKYGLVGSRDSANGSAMVDRRQPAGLLERKRGPSDDLTSPKEKSTKLTHGNPPDIFKFSAASNAGTVPYHGAIAGSSPSAVSGTDGSLSKTQLKNQKQRQAEKAKKAAAIAIAEKEAEEASLVEGGQGRLFKFP